MMNGIIKDTDCAMLSNEASVLSETQYTTDFYLSLKRKQSKARKSTCRSGTARIELRIQHKPPHLRRHPNSPRHPLALL